MQSALVRSALRPRAPVSLRSSVLQRRAFHVDNVVNNTTPFKTDYDSRRSFAIKLTAFMLSGFLLPVAASVYQLKKRG